MPLLNRNNRLAGYAHGLGQDFLSNTPSRTQLAQGVDNRLAHTDIVKHALRQVNFTSYTRQKTLCTGSFQVTGQNGDDVWFAARQRTRPCQSFFQGRKAPAYFCFSSGVTRRLQSRSLMTPRRGGHQNHYPGVCLRTVGSRCQKWFSKLVIARIESALIHSSPRDLPCPILLGSLSYASPIRSYSSTNCCTGACRK